MTRHVNLKKLSQLRRAGWRSALDAMLWGDPPHKTPRVITRHVIAPRRLAALYTVHYMHGVKVWHIAFEHEAQCAESRVDAVSIPDRVCQDKLHKTQHAVTLHKTQRSKRMNSVALCVTRSRNPLIVNAQRACADGLTGMTGFSPMLLPDSL